LTAAGIVRTSQSGCVVCALQQELLTAVVH